MAKFAVNYSFRGRSTAIVEAETKEEAQASVEKEVNADDFELDADEIDDIDFMLQEMHPVTRDGREIWSTWVAPTDVRGHRSALASSPLFGGI